MIITRGQPGGASRDGPAAVEARIRSVAAAWARRGRGRGMQWGVVTWRSAHQSATQISRLVLIWSLPYALACSAKSVSGTA
jgi:hypothetical protein